MCELCAPPSCIGHGSLAVQHAIRASGVGVISAHKATGPAVSETLSAAAATHRRRRVTDLECAPPAALSMTPATAKGQNPTTSPCAAQGEGWLNVRER